MNKTKNILLVGVGGQGIILTSKILTEALVEKGYDVLMSEVHGMAQRGGSVTTVVRFGEKVNSPIIEKGEVDILVSFEKCEALRWVNFLKKDGIIIINNYEIYPVSVNIGNENYPKDIETAIKKEVPNTFIIEAFKIAEELGNSKVQNLVLLGALAKALNLSGMDYESAIEKSLPEKLFEINKKAFNIGFGNISK